MYEVRHITNSNDPPTVIARFDGYRQAELYVLEKMGLTGDSLPTTYFGNLYIRYVKEEGKEDSDNGGV